MTEDNIFYIVSDEYVEINGFKYFVPMSSPKDKDYANGKIKKNNLTTIYLRSKEKLYGTLRFNSMIPVPESELSLYKINDEGDFSYKLLMLVEYSFCKENRDKIEKTAKNLYEKKCSASEEEFPVGRIVIDFKKVEEACWNYKK